MSLQETFWHLFQLISFVTSWVYQTLSEQSNGIQSKSIVSFPYFPCVSDLDKKDIYFKPSDLSYFLPSLLLSSNLPLSHLGNRLFHLSLIPIDESKPIWRFSLLVTNSEILNKLLFMTLLFQCSFLLSSSAFLLLLHHFLFCSLTR